MYELIKSIVYKLTKVPLIGKGVVYLLNLRRSWIMKKNSSKVQSNGADASRSLYYEECILGLRECLQRHEATIMMLQKQVELLKKTLAENEKK